MPRKTSTKRVGRAKPHPEIVSVTLAESGRAVTVDHAFVEHRPRSPTCEIKARSTDDFGGALSEPGCSEPCHKM